MANTLLNIDMITNEALAILENELTFTKQVNRDYDDSFAKSGAKIGDIINIRKPIRSVGRRTAAFNPSGDTETSIPFQLTTQWGDDFAVTSKEMTLNIDEFSKRILAPKVATIANMIDYDGMQLYKDVYQAVGTPGTTPTSNLTYLSAGVKLDNVAAPAGMRKAVINPIAQATIVNNNLSLFNPGKNISDQYTDGNIGKALGLSWSMDQNVGVQTTGTFAAAASGAGTAVTVNGAVTSGNTVVLAGWTSGDILNAGDIVTFANVYTVNPQNRQSTGQLQQFVVTATATASGGGAMTLSLSPAVVFSGALQNVTSSTNSIANGSVCTVYGASAIVTPQNLVFHPDAFTFGCADLDIPMGVVEGKNGYRVASKKLGLSIRAVWFYDGNNDRSNLRLDVLGGWKTLRPELACRVMG